MRRNALSKLRVFTLSSRVTSTSSSPRFPRFLPPFFLLFFLLAASADRTSGMSVGSSPCGIVSKSKSGSETRLRAAAVILIISPVCHSRANRFFADASLAFLSLISAFGASASLASSSLRPSRSTSASKRLYCAPAPPPPLLAPPQLLPKAGVAAPMSSTIASAFLICSVTNAVASTAAIASVSCGLAACRSRSWALRIKSERKSGVVPHST
mmetsp:Transcript_8247/g.14880  ORF Transcript_8247/g.14880 Transcript_8247/m.14880 type:complete len:212 (-) Transcript_8247:867-1502(-)